MVFSLNYYVKYHLKVFCNSSCTQTIYYAVFDSYARYAYQIGGKIQRKIFDMIHHAQNKALRIISFKQFMEPSEHLYNQLKINSLKNNIILKN